MNRLSTNRSIGSLLCIAALAGCGAPDEGGRDITEWMGDDYHFEAVGFLHGEELDISLGASAADSTLLFCTREYTVPQAADGTPRYDQGQLTELKINAFVEVEGERRQIELELKRHDFQADAVGTETAIVPRTATGEPGASEAWLEWEWHDESDATTFEAAGQTGTVVLELYDGQPDETGLVIPDGMGAVGVHWTARWSETEEIRGSFTVPCTTSVVVEVVAP
ncbi:hypothetical protein [Sandaracinus amylolyticus]|uniref:Lipoprotein n=1 Tax=Sandaracinus amylolyticus TaxID=927083 RepID=A0A0F6VZW3_9BACT|nr:hypothetical protein [Sandaracinus amylolyticus]AKF03900.1 hypothetical protein DB32_001049 [Sandaracinus amylolyticus]